ncbi:peptidoglycan-associated lipoprotein Pal [Kushneria phosphatilytica]|uniref:Peptidoglycan-associated protein n=1 Tax=Kushneria phosphatilytica TaxID=657387 RepID=A0A1S1NXQ2_9GAMM|nr:peptidoglycan-associated lipoprotein Pal [Kushneria phosphatilytica]OHV12352.1 peptidoglycan-associated lipoprotein [Kushneria phosphatilytica]QEL11126.1 peptidoglycan-associated lipoprotein Pal [Kushneria phosphatilytica]
MQFTNYAKTLTAALSLAVIAGCSSGGGTQDGEMGGMSSGNTGANAQGMSSSQGAQGSSMGQNDQMPSETTVYFDFDSSNIRSEYESVLNRNASYLQSHPDTNVVLEGHTDPRGTREYNMALGERRANSVKQYLTIQGVSASQIEVVSYGEERPAMQGNSEQAYAKDRRVVIDY